MRIFAVNQSVLIVKNETRAMICRIVTASLNPEIVAVRHGPPCCNVYEKRTNVATQRRSTTTQICQTTINLIADIIEVLKCIQIFDGVVIVVALLPIQQRQCCCADCLATSSKRRGKTIENRKSLTPKCVCVSGVCQRWMEQQKQQRMVDCYIILFVLVGPICILCRVFPHGAHLMLVSPAYRFNFND